MPRQRKGSRIYRRKQGSTVRYYADFRDYADVEGKREALIPEDAKTATTDRDVAEKLVADRLAELERKRRRKDLGIVERHPQQKKLLKPYARDHLVAKASTGEFTTKWLEADQRHLESAIEFLGPATPLEEIRVSDVREWAAHLRQQQTRGGRPLAPSTRRKYLNSLSNLFEWAASDEVVPEGFNPVKGMKSKPSGVTRTEARWLEVHEGALLLESARTYSPDPDASAFGFHHELIATFLLTGGRLSEVLGLTIDDVSFERGTVTFRPHEHRRLKTKTSHRPVPLWPQLREILLPYIEQRDEGPDALLFPGRNGGMVQELRKALDTIAGRAGWAAGEIRTKMLRHTFCAARLQTLDRGAPVSPFTVAREMGHGGRALVDRVYGHLGTVRHRSEVVEYRVEHWTQELGRKLTALRAVA